MALSNRFRPGLELGDYYPEAAKQIFTPKQARDEYNRLRKIANRRLEALQRNFPESKAAREFRGGFPAASGEADRRIYQRLYEVARYMSRKLGSVTGEREYRRRMIQSLHEVGYTWINKRNFDDFTKFMEEVKTHSTYRQYDSERVLELFHETLKKKAKPQAVAASFELYLSKEKDVEDTKDKPGSISSIFAAYAQSDRKQKKSRKK